MELMITKAAIDLPHEISNLAALKEELIPKLEKYNNLVVTEDSIKEAKADKANLNKLRKAIEEQRISIKKQYLEPYNVLEAQCKEVVALIDAPIQAIDKQIKIFDEIEKNDKYTALSEAFTALNPPEWVQISDVLNPKWENKTQKLESLKAEMAECCNKMLADFDKLMDMYKDFPHKLAIEQKYKEVKDFSKAAVYAAQLATHYRMEKKRQAEQLKIVEPSESVVNAPVSDSENSNINIPPTMQNGINGESERFGSATANEDKILRGSFRVECPKSKLIALVDFMKSQGIKYQCIK